MLLRIFKTVCKCLSFLSPILYNNARMKLGIKDRNNSNDCQCRISIRKFMSYHLSLKLSCQQHGIYGVY